MVAVDILQVPTSCQNHRYMLVIQDYFIGLWELYSKFLSLFYSEFLLKSLHYAQFYSFYAYDFIIILHLQVNY